MNQQTKLHAIIRASNKTIYQMNRDSVTEKA